MPRYFARRYYRRLEWMGRVEVAVGAFLLLLMVTIVAGFVVQGPGSSGELYAVDPDVYRTSEDPHEQAVARKMLPELDRATWLPDGEVEAIGASKLAEALNDDAADLTNFGVQWVYRQRWKGKDDPASGLTVTVCDAATPAQAFGLCRVRRPQQWDPLRSGHDGWISRTARGAGFWNGRYYTELRAGPADSDPTDLLTQEVGIVASAQLDYGASFWADHVLPFDGRVPETLRYVHRRALGVEGLNEAFLADLSGGVTAWVTQAGSASRAADIVAELATLADQAGDGDGGYGSEATAARTEGELTIVPWDQGALAAVAVGDRVYGAWGVDSAAVTAAAQEMYSRVALPVGVAAAPERRPTEADSPFPPPGVDGWQAPRRVDRFTADNLYVKINGRADVYLQFKVVGLTFATYQHQTVRDRAIDVYWYDMGEGVNAFGIYQAEAPPEAEAVAVGRAGYQVGGAVFYWKGASYVQVLPTSSDPSDSAAALEIARRIDARIGDTQESLWALSLLPESGRVKDSFAYLAQDVFGLDFLADVFTAVYDVDGGRLMLFIHRADDEPSALGLLEEYEAFFEKYGRVIWASPDASRRIVAGAVAGVTDVVFAKGRYLAGVAGAENEDRARQAATEFFDGLNVP